MKKLIAAICVVLTAGVLACGSTQVLVGQEEGWKLLGFEKVNHLPEKDVFKLSSTEKFTALRLFVKERDVEIKYVKITLINGDVLQPSIEKVIKSDDRSRVVDLGAEGRQLDSIEIRYSASGKVFSKKGIVLLAAKRYDPNGKY